MTDEMKEVAELFMAQRVIGRQAALIDLLAHKLDVAEEQTKHIDCLKHINEARSLIASYRLMGD